jgi:hypothetical protein
MNIKRTLSLLLLGANATLFAQDVIIKENGDEIKAKVTEVGTDVIKYKKFGNEQGPTYVISKQELFMIKYQNGTKEVIEKTGSTPQQTQTPAQPYTPPAQSYTPPPVQAAPAPIVQQSTQKETESKSSYNDDFENNNFGLDLGYAGILDGEGSTINAGVRWLHNFNPYIGWDILDIKGNLYSDAIISQVMTGIRLFTPRFGENMCFYGAFKMGEGFIFFTKQGSGGYFEDFTGFAYEFELGFQVSKVFVAFLFNKQGGSTVYHDLGYYYNNYVVGFNLKYCGLRLGFNF